MAIAYRAPAPAETPAARRATAERRGRPRPVPRGVRSVVLVVESDDAFRTALTSALRQRGLLVDQAGDGIAALYALAQRTPDAVVLDMDVVGVTGHRLFDILRLDPQTRRVPVVVLSERDAQESCPRPAAGAPPECYLRKPVSADVVLRELAHVGAQRANVHA